LKFDIKVRANWRAPTCAALIGSGVGLALGAAYMAGGMARAATDHSRSARLAEAAAGGFSESVLQREAAAMDPGVLRIARRHDPFTVAGDAERDRQSVILVSRLDTSSSEPRQQIKLRTSFHAPAASPFHLAGALETSRELECLTQAVYFEARGETPAGQAAVAQVVLNRVRHPAFPKSVCSVVFQGSAKRTGCQFSFACNGSMHAGRESDAWRRAQKVASRALSGTVMAGVGDATHFHTINVAPNWGPRLMRTAQVGLHVFYRFGRGAGGAYARPGHGPEPEMTAQPVYASADQVPAAPSTPKIPLGEYRLASATKMQAETATAAAEAAPKTVVEARAPAKSETAKLTPTSAPRQAADTVGKAPV
jgi:spore germination cell wall hydrolase CwlJ-like protein